MKLASNIQNQKTGVQRVYTIHSYDVPTSDPKRYVALKTSLLIQLLL
jgi:hypothetical protein